MSYLLADIGGSHARFAFINKGKMGKISVLDCDDFKTPFDLIDKILLKKSQKLEGIFLAAAGPVQKGCVQWTNRPHWRIAENQLKRYYKVKKVKIYNDLYAQGVGVHVSKTKTICLMNVGTGFGACLIRKGEIIPCEFGLTLDENNNKKETYLSGSGIVRFYHDLGGDKKIKSAKKIDDMRPKKDKIAQEAYHRFYSLWGKTAGNIATGLMIQGGVCLWGGLAPNNTKDFNDFMKSFHHKSYPEFTKKIPVQILKEKSLTLKGLKILSTN